MLRVKSIYSIIIISKVYTIIQASPLIKQLAPRRVSSSCPLLAMPIPFLKSHPSLMFWSYPRFSASLTQMIFLDPSKPMVLSSYAPPGTIQTLLRLDTAQPMPWNSSSWMEPTAQLAPMLRPKFIKSFTFLLSSVLFSKAEKYAWP